MEFFLPTFLATFLASIITVIMTAFSGYLFRNQIKGKLLGNDLVPAHSVPRILFETWFLEIHEQEELHYSFSLENCGQVNMSNIRFFYCNWKEKNSLQIFPIKVNLEHGFINDGKGEKIQYHVQLSAAKMKELLESEGIPFGNRFFVEMTDSSGVKYRQTIYYNNDGTTSQQPTSRISRRLPNRSRRYANEKKIKRAEKRYTLDLARG